jgi:hypothetical protein
MYFTESHLFDVTGPESELGYASFVRTVDGGHVLKRKWYAEDAFARREKLYPELDVPPIGFEGHLRNPLGLQVTAMPPFRYDVQCESMTTGHIYGIFLDHCSLLDAPDVVLSQCEDEVLAWMERISTWLELYLNARGLATELTYLFQRNTLMERPHLPSVRRCLPRLPGRRNPLPVRITSLGRDGGTVSGEGCSSARTQQ